MAYLVLLVRLNLALLYYVFGGLFLGAHERVLFHLLYYKELL